MAGAFAGKSVLANMVYGVSTSDPFTYAAVAALLTGVAALACFPLPARASRLGRSVVLPRPWKLHFFGPHQPDHLANL